MAVLSVEKSLEKSRPSMISQSTMSPNSNVTRSEVKSLLLLGSFPVQLKPPFVTPVEVIGESVPAISSTKPVLSKSARKASKCVIISPLLMGIRTRLSRLYPIGLSLANWIWRKMKIVPIIKLIETVNWMTTSTLRGIEVKRPLRTVPFKTFTGWKADR